MLHRVLRLLLLPPDFERRRGDQMEETFREALRCTKSPGARRRLWLREAVDLWRTGREMRRRGTVNGAPVMGRNGSGRWGTMGRGWMDDLRYAIRGLMRRPAFTGFAVATIALGIGATTAIWSTIEGVVLRPIPYERADRMVSLLRTIGDSGYRTPAAEQIAVWEGWDDVFAAVEPMSLRQMTWTGDGDPVQIDVGLIRASFHDFSGRAPMLGRAFSEDEVENRAPVALISHGLWKRRFGGARSVLGRGMELDGVLHTIVGVMPRNSPILGFSAAPVEAWTPLGPSSRGVLPIGILQPGVTLESANARLSSPIALEDGAEVRGAARDLVEQFSGTIRDQLWALMAAVGVLLLIACLNVSNLLLTREQGRRRETAVRAALGGGRFRIARQTAIEGLLLGAVGGTAGIVLSVVGLELLLSLRPASLDALDRVAPNGSVLAVSIAITLGASVLFSLLPIWTQLRRDAGAELGSGARGSRGGPGGSRLRWVLVSTEVALSFALVVGSVLVFDAMRELRSREAGFDAERVLVVDFALPQWRFGDPIERQAAFDRVMEAAARHPSVERLARSQGAPPDVGLRFGEIRVEGEEPLDGVQFVFGPSVTADYFETLGQAVRGRSWTAEDEENDAAVVVLAESTARRLFGAEDPIGRRFRIGGGEDSWLTVVGVADDALTGGYDADRDRLYMYDRMTPSYGVATSLLARMRPGTDAERLGADLRAIVHGVSADARIDGISTLEARLAGTLDRERFTSTLLSTFALMALGLAAIGLFGVVSQLVGGRTREIGIRMALGADRVRIRAMILRYGTIATGAGIVVGGVVARFGTSVLSSQVFGVEHPGPVAYGIAAAVLGGVALLSCWVPARRATRIDPMVAIRTE